MADLQAVYARTQAGLQEIKARALHLTREQRNLLIVIDGKSALGSFAKISGCVPEQMGEVVAPLVRHGLIAAVGSAPSPPAAPGAPTTGQMQAGASAQALIALAEQVFGAHAGPVVRKLEKAGSSAAELRAAAGSGAKLAKLTIDENKARLFLAEALKLIEG